MTWGLPVCKLCKLRDGSDLQEHPEKPPYKLQLLNALGALHSMWPSRYKRNGTVELTGVLNATRFTFSLIIAKFLS